jgi:CubicO group peptidase (beta-lactamase class C family)
MKKTVTLLFLLFTIAGASAQSRDEQHKAILDRVIAFYNSGDYKTLYTLFSPEFKSRIPEQELVSFLTGMGAYGKVTATEYSYDKEGFKVYKTTLEKGLFNFILACNDNWLITGFAIVPYKEPPTKTPADMLTDNKKSTPLELEVDKAVAEFMLNPNNAGLSIVIIKDGATYFYNYGETKKGSGQLPGSATIYEIGSITKTFTGILLAKALEDKKLSLYDDVRKFLPVKCSDLAFGNHPVAIKHLANHTGQIARIPDNLDQQPYYDEQDPYKNYNSEMLYDYLSTLQLKDVPGITQDYSNTGMCLLGLILEKVYEQNYEKLVKAYIAKPLKMNSTFVELPDNQKDKFASGYYKGIEAPHWHFADIPAAGGLKSTIGDMALYLKANIDNATPYIQFSHEPTFKNKDESTGLGWFIMKTLPGNTLLWHNGGTYGFSSFMGYIKEKRCGIVILGNSFTEGELDTVGTNLLKYMQQ